jgi:hypothetical protein
MTHASEEVRNRVPEKPVREARTTDPGQRPRVMFSGNSYDLTALAALVTGITVMLMCLTFGQAAYCLPFAAIALGIVGLVMRREAVNPERTGLWSWLGIGAGGLTLLVGLLLIFSYFACFFFMMLLSWRSSY